MDTSQIKARVGHFFLFLGFAFCLTAILRHLCQHQKMQLMTLKKRCNKALRMLRNVAFPASHHSNRAGVAKNEAQCQWTRHCSRSKGAQTRAAIWTRCYEAWQVALGISAWPFKRPEKMTPDLFFLPDRSSVTSREKSVHSFILIKNVEILVWWHLRIQCTLRFSRRISPFIELIFGR